MADSAIHVDASIFQGKLETLAETVARCLQDQWPSEYENLPFAQTFFLFNLRFSLYAFQTECELYSDERREDCRWTWSKLVVLPPTNRAVLDSLFNVVFMLENVEEHIQLYLRSGWREMKLEYDRFAEEYGDQDEWRDWLSKIGQLVHQDIALFGVMQSDIAEPKKIKQWPSSGQMPDYGISGNQNRPPARQFLHYLSDWFYREHSGIAHLSFLGMIKLGAVLNFPDLASADRETFSKETLPRVMTSHVVRSAILLLSIVSELQNHFGFKGDMALRILEIWHILIPNFAEARQVFARRYNPLFPALLLTP